MDLTLLIALACSRFTISHNDVLFLPPASIAALTLMLHVFNCGQSIRLGEVSNCARTLAEYYDRISAPRYQSQSLDRLPRLASIVEKDRTTVGIVTQLVSQLLGMILISTLCKCPHVRSIYSPKTA